METVTRTEFKDFINSWGDALRANVVKGSTMSVMQYIHTQTGVVMAQAVYYRGSKPRYEIRRTP